MNKKAFLALLLAIGIPVISYFVMKSISDNAIQLPRYYLLDTVTTKIVDGKQESDSIWHKVADIKLVNQLGDTVHLYDIKNKVIVADFFFTSCGTICPYLTHNMARMQQSFTRGGDGRNKIDTSLVQFLSFSIDPERDSVPRLKQYADRYQAIHDNWWFLTGPKDSIYNFIFQQLKVDKYNNDTPIDPNFAHTGRFVLIDRDFHVRGYYNGLDTVGDLPKMANDIALLMLEKDKDHPAPLPFDPVIMAVFLGITILVVIFVLRLLFRKKKSTGVVNTPGK